MELRNGHIGWFFARSSPLNGSILKSTEFSPATLKPRTAMEAYGNATRDPSAHESSHGSAHGAINNTDRDITF